MTSGGARNRSGYLPGEDSERGRAEARSFLELPASGYQGEVPAFPLPEASGRELEVWAELWGSPQAFAWAGESWRWPAVAMYVRVRVRAEDPDAPATLLAQIHRFADQVGLTPAGLRENGWRIAKDASPARKPKAPVKRQRRLRAVDD